MAAKLVCVQRRYHLRHEHPEGKIHDFEWRFTSLDAAAACDFVVSAKIQSAVKTQGCRPINMKADQAISRVVF